MKILLLLGQSGVGKTTVAQELCKNEERYHFVDSFTDRQKRDKNEWGHIFVDSDYMDAMFKDPTLVAKTEIAHNRYCSLEYQFEKDKVNVYIVDLEGLNNVIDFFPQADIMTILLTKNNFTFDCDERTSRDIALPCREDVDFLIENEGSVKSTVGTINTLVTNDWFRKPSHKVTTIEDALEDIYEKRRYLDAIQQSLEYQKWHRDKDIYIKIVDYLSEKQYDDYDVKIVRDDDPSWDGEGCSYYVFALYKEEDLKWTDTDRIYGLVSKNIHDYCNMHNLGNFYWRFNIQVLWEDEFIGF